MEIGQIGAGSLAGTALNQSASQPTGAARTRPQAPVTGESQASAAQGAVNSRRRALSILSQEIRQALAVNFRINIGSALPAYSLGSGPQSPADVAGDALGAGRALARRAPLDASRSLVDLRKKVQDAADDVREIVGDDDDDDVDDTLRLIGDGLDDLEEDAARHVASSASVLSYESQLRQRSTIRIRTQEGDIVRLDLRRTEQMSASDVALSNGELSFSATEVAVSSRTRMVLTVNGDLNEAEFAALQNVFAQAAAIADEFFAGDLAKAFDMTAGIELDTEQLARVRMRFRERLETNISYAEIRRLTPQPVQLPEPGLVIGTPSAPETGPIARSAAGVVVPDVPEVEDTVATPAEPEATTTAASPALADGAGDGFLALLADFLRSVNDGFEPEAGSLRYFYSQSFRLEILKSVLEMNAPEGFDAAADKAATLIDGVIADADD